MRRAWTIAPLVVACTCPEGAVCPSDTAADTAPAGADADPARWPADPATWGPADVPDRIEGALAGGVGDPWGTLRGWLALFAHADPGCPAGDAWSLPIDHDGCETGEGWHFAGTGFLRRIESAGSVGFSLSNDCEVIEPDGTTYVGSGTLGLLVPTEAGSFWVKASGNFAWPSAGGLLGAGYSVWTDMGGTMTADGGAFTLDGIWATDDAVVSFEGVAVDTASCPGGTGTVGLRDPSGGWHALALDPSCDGCGTVSYDGVETGHACVDLAPRWAASLAALRPSAAPW